MTVNIKSIQAQLLNLAKEQKSDFQYLLNRLAAEQFLYRLSQSPYDEQLIFKGGTLLTYLIDSNRRTRDLDFSMQHISGQVSAVTKVIQSIVAIPVDDGLTWGKVSGEALAVPEMDYPGIRMSCAFLFGTMRGVLRMDMAIGDVVEGITIPLERMAYKGHPIFGDPFPLLVYPPETIFAEKLQTVVRKHSQNTRMKDYYDLWKLIDHDMDTNTLRKNIQAVFIHRDTPLTMRIKFDDTDIALLEAHWDNFIRRDKMTDAPATISEVIGLVNGYLKRLT